MRMRTTVSGTPCLDRSPEPADGLRLFCFPHAGGGASSFATWQAALGPSVTVFPVQLPGREDRAEEPRFRDVEALAAELDDQIDPALDGPFAWYGHSMGALVAHALARRRHARGASLPRALLIGASPGPQAEMTLDEHVDDARLVQFMIDVGGAPALIQRFPQWVGEAAALLRDDLAVVRGARHRPTVALPVPITVFTGADDPVMTPGDARAWAAHTSEGLAVQVVPGGHFFPRQSRASFLPLLSERLSDLIPAGERNRR